MAKNLKAKIDKWTKPLKEHTLYIVAWEDHVSVKENSDKSLLKPAILVTIGLYLGETSKMMTLFTEWDPDEEEWCRDKAGIIKKNIVWIKELKVGS